MEYDHTEFLVIWEEKYKNPTVMRVHQCYENKYWTKIYFVTVMDVYFWRILKPDCRKAESFRYYSAQQCSMIRTLYKTYILMSLESI